MRRAWAGWWGIWAVAIGAGCETDAAMTADGARDAAEGEVEGEGEGEFEVESESEGEVEVEVEVESEVETIEVSASKLGIYYAASA